MNFTDPVFIKVECAVTILEKNAADGGTVIL